jgi:signal peptidase I
MSKVKHHGAATSPAAAGAAASNAGEEHGGRATRETIESIAVAVILAFLFRAFVAEAFVIPTGSMAPTLQGRHMDVTCSQCGCPYRTGASVENEGHGEVQGTTCPICRFPMQLDKERDPNQRSFNGDRILVSKFAYETSDPKRWDVIVFKFPGNAKQNYIKRLVGLPNETLRIRHGDIYVRSEQAGEAADDRFHIVRKPPHKLTAMLQVVDDTRYRPAELTAVGWPSRWQDWSAAGAATWHPCSEGPGFQTDAWADGPAWLRYRHVVPRIEDWEDVANGKVPRRLADGELQGQLITDYYAYNDSVEGYRYAKAIGMHWVGDLAVFAEGVEVQGDQGAVLLDLVEGGVHYTCRIDVATGQAELSIAGGQRVFRGQNGAELAHPRAATRLRGPGKYDLRFSNCDDQLLLWVNGRLAEFDGPTTYEPDRDVKPQWSSEAAGDLEPAGFAAEGVAVRVSNLQVLRDVYYVASSYLTEENNRIPAEDDYEDLLHTGSRVDFVTRVFSRPQTWATTPLFDARREDVQFRMGPDEFFPLGDNSPQSRDARVWSQYGDGEQPHPPPFVRRDLLTGKALLIYWPHAWRRPIPFLPNFRRMGLIR